MKHSPAPWFNREGTILADTREQVCCGRACVGAEYMGQQEMVCCGNPDVDGDEEDPIATVKYEQDIPLILAAPELLAALKACVAAMEHGDFSNGVTDPNGTIDEGNVRASEVIRQAVSAIAKASGVL